MLASPHAPSRNPFARCLSRWVVTAGPGCTYGCEGHPKHLTSLSPSKYPPLFCLSLLPLFPSPSAPPRQDRLVELLEELSDAHSSQLSPSTTVTKDNAAAGGLLGDNGSASGGVGVGDGDAMSVAGLDRDALYELVVKAAATNKANYAWLQEVWRVGCGGSWLGLLPLWVVKCTFRSLLFGIRLLLYPAPLLTSVPPPHTQAHPSFSPLACRSRTGAVPHPHIFISPSLLAGQGPAQGPQGAEAALDTRCRHDGGLLAVVSPGSAECVVCRFLAAPSARWWIPGGMFRPSPHPRAGERFTPRSRYPGNWEALGCLNS